jgi:transposase
MWRYWQSMAGVTRINIHESAETLAQLLREPSLSRHKERIQVLYLIKVEHMSVSAAAMVVGKHRGSVQRWLATYRDRGLEALLEHKTSPGRPRQIPVWAETSLKRQLAEPESRFQRYTQVQQWLEETLGVKATYATVHRLTRYRLKAKLKVPRPRNRKQDPRQLAAFKKTLSMTCN